MSRIDRGWPQGNAMARRSAEAALAGSAVLALVGFATAGSASPDPATDTGFAPKAVEAQPASDDRARLNALVVQADALAAQGKFSESLEVLLSAQSLARESTAIDRLQEAEVLDRVAIMQGRLGRIEEANRLAAEALEIRSRTYRADTLEMADALMIAANWYRMSGQVERELEAETSAVAIMGTRLGMRHHRLATPLIMMGTSVGGFLKDPRQAEVALSRAIELDYGTGADEQLLHAEALAAMGDLKVLYGPIGDGAILYTRAWNVIAAHDQLGSTAANRYFETPRRLFIFSPSLVTDVGIVELTFTVTAMGTVSDVTGRGRQIANRIEREAITSGAKDALRRSRYRPRVVDGRPVDTPEMRFTYGFCPQGSRIGDGCDVGRESSPGT